MLSVLAGRLVWSAELELWWTKLLFLESLPLLILKSGHEKAGEVMESVLIGGSISGADASRPTSTAQQQLGV